MKITAYCLFKKNNNMHNVIYVYNYEMYLMNILPKYIFVYKI